MTTGNLRFLISTIFSLALLLIPFQAALAADDGALTLEQAEQLSDPIHTDNYGSDLEYEATTTGSDRCYRVPNRGQECSCTGNTCTIDGQRYNCEKRGQVGRKNYWYCPEKIARI